MKTNTIALSALTLATITVALPVVSEVNHDVSDSLSLRLAARQVAWPNTNSVLPAAGLNIPALTQSGLTDGLTKNLLGVVSGNTAGGLTGVDSVPARLLSAIAAVNPFAGLLASTLANVLASVPVAIISGTPVSIDGLIPGALAGITAGLPSAIPVADVLQGLLPSTLPDLASALPNLASALPNAVNPLEGLLPGLLTGLPAGLGLSLPTLAPVVTSTSKLPVAVPTQSVASAGAVTPVAIPTTVLQQVPTLVTSTVITAIPTVVPTRVVQAVPTNILGLLQPILPPSP